MSAAFDQLIEEQFSAFVISNIYNVWTRKSEVVCRGVETFQNMCVPYFHALKNEIKRAL
jgi:hypothetical protein